MQKWRVCDNTVGKYVLISSFQKKITPQSQKGEIGRLLSKSWDPFAPQKQKRRIYSRGVKQSFKLARRALRSISNSSSLTLMLSACEAENPVITVNAKRLELFCWDANNSLLFHLLRNSWPSSRNLYYFANYATFSTSHWGDGKLFKNKRWFICVLSLSNASFSYYYYQNTHCTSHAIKKKSTAYGTLNTHQQTIKQQYSHL